MFKSFFPKPGPFFISAFMWSLLAVIFWQAGGGDWLLRVTGASQDVAISAARFWSLNYLVFYAFYVFCVGVFALFWFIYSPHRWQYWSILGTSLIIFVTWFLVEVGVAINAWYAPFYDLIQAALATPHKVSINQFYQEIGIFPTLSDRQHGLMFAEEQLIFFAASLLLCLKQGFKSICLNL